MKKHLRLSVLLFLGSFLFASCDKDDDKPKPVDQPSEAKHGSIEMHFDSRFGTEDFELNDVYTTANNDQIKIARAGYYISNVELVKADGSTFKEPKSYHLIWLEDGITKETFKITNVPADDYVKIRFMVGVDSVQNETVPGEGDLAPDTHMSWMWTTSYIFFHAKGYYQTTPGGAFDGIFGYDIGHNRSLRQVELTLPNAKRVDDSNSPKVHIYSDFKVAFSGPNVMDIRAVPIIGGSPTSAAASELVADNYATMFKIHGVH